jgi:hypothetical protein
MIAFAIEFLVFVVCVVIIVLILQWAVTKLGWTIDPGLRVIVGLIIFLVCLLVFLNMVGVLTGNGFNFHRINP